MNVGINTLGHSAKLSVNGGLYVGEDSDSGNDDLLVDGKAEIKGNLDHDRSKVGFFGVTPISRQHH